MARTLHFTSLLRGTKIIEAYGFLAIVASLVCEIMGLTNSPRKPIGPCVFIGYSPQHKGYWCFHPTTNRVYISFHVVFDEHNYPFTSSINSSLQIPLEMVEFPDSESWTCKETVHYNIPCAQGEHATLDQNPCAHSQISNCYTASLSSAPATLQIATTVSPQIPVPCAPIPPQTAPTIPQHPSANSLSSEREHAFMSSTLVQESASLPLFVHIHDPDALDKNLVIDLHLPPTTSIDAAPTNAHPMITRHKLQSNLDLVAQMVLLSSTSESKSLTALNSSHWRTAMQEELAALHHNHTWVLVPRPPYTNVVGSKWVFRTKFKDDRSIDRFKAHLVVKGFTQILGQDFEKTFSPVIKQTRVHLILSTVVTWNWTIRQPDIKNAFLRGHLQETIYIEQPLGFIDSSFPTHVCLFKRSIYGLKQATPRVWFVSFISKYNSQDWLINI